MKLTDRQWRLIESLAGGHTSDVENRDGRTVRSLLTRKIIRYTLPPRGKYYKGEIGLNTNPKEQWR